MSLATAVARVALGLVFVIAGASKVFAHGAAADAFARYGVPAPGPSVWIVGALEIVCGGLLAGAILIRPVGLLLATIMVGTALTAGRALGGVALVAPIVLFCGCVWLAWQSDRSPVAFPARPPGVQ